ncbi:MAG: hypothetical protein Fur0025_46590 [Oscillatoriaceae cyanobacterium]
MEWLVLAGIGLIAIAICTVLYVNHQRRSLPRSRSDSHSALIYSRGNRFTSADEITWTDIPVSASDGNGWREINNTSEAGQISWVELEIDQPPVEQDEDFLDPDLPDDLDNILREVIGTKDLWSQDTFMPGEQVYLCRLHRLAYHEDSWIESGNKCYVCGNDAHTGQYRLPRL